MQLYKTFDSSGIAPDGVLYAGDLNAIEALAAALEDFTQIIQLATLEVGDDTIQLSKLGAGAVGLSAALKTTGVLQALGGLVSGTYTTTQMNAIASPPYGLVILNTTTNEYMWQAAPSGSPNWQSISAAALITSVFGRTGAVVAANNDYNDAQIQNSPTNILTSKGDLLIASGPNILGRLGLGSTGQVLTALSSGLPGWSSAASGSIPRVTSLPGSPSDGQQVLLDLNSVQTGTVWLCTYRTSSGYWDVVGTPLAAYCAGGGPNGGWWEVGFIAAPFPGDYLASTTISAQGNLFGTDAGISKGASAPSLLAFGNTFGTAFNASGISLTTITSSPLTGLTAGEHISSMVNDSGNASWTGQIEVRPVRIN